MKKFTFSAAAAFLFSTATAAPTLPVPRHDTLHEYQAACSVEAGFDTFAAQISCVKGLIAESADRIVNRNDPNTQLYVMTAEKLVGDVAAKRKSVANARIDLQRVLIEVESHQQANAAMYVEEQRQARIAAAVQRQADSEAKQQADHEAFLREQVERQRDAEYAARQAEAEREVEDAKQQRRRAVLNALAEAAQRQQQDRPRQTNCQTIALTPGMAQTNCTTY